MERLQPKLRFPEFEGDWIFKFGNELFEPISDKNHKSDLPILAISQEFGAIPRDLIDYKISVTDKSIDSYKIVRKGNFIISLRSFQGGIEYSNYEGICSPAYIILGSTLKMEDVFYKYYLKTDSYILKLQSKLEGIRDGKMISFKYFSEIKLPYPDLGEQQKIAQFLTQVDQKINQLTQKQTLLEQYKKGIMQQLFTQKLRFKDDNGKEYPEWEEKTLGEVGEIVTGKTPSTSDLDLWDGDIQFITPSDIDENLKYQEETERYVKLVPKMKVLPPKTIIYTCIASIGKMCLSLKPCITNQQINSIIPFKDYNNEFIYYWLFYLTPKIKSTQANTTLPIINKTDFLKFKIFIPNDEEQTKIANFLSAIDDKINQVKTQLEKTKTFKKGLLQQMFV